MAAVSLDESLSLSSFLRSSENQARKYECLICLELLFKPKLLRCMGAHTFCENCLQKHIDKHSTFDRTSLEYYFFCPACKDQVAVPRNGAAGFQTNYYISGDVDRLRAKAMKECDICTAMSDPQAPQKRKASRICCDCSHNLCKPCSKIHSDHFPTHTVERLFPRSAPVSNSGTLPPRARYLSLSENTQPKLPRPPSSPESCKTMCSIHPSEELRFFCKGNDNKPCETIICRDCRMTDHFHHSHVTDLKKMMEQSRLQLQNHEKEVQSRISALTTRQQAVQTWQEGVQNSKNQVETLLKARAERLITAITAHRDQALSWLEVQAEEADKRALEEMNVTRGAVFSLQDMLVTLQQTARAGSDVEKVRVSVAMDHVLQEKENPAATGAELLPENCGSSPRGFLLNSNSSVNEDIPAEVLGDLLGKIVRL